MKVLLVALGGGLGAVLRYCVILCMNRFNLSSKYATIIVNLVGSFFIGYILNNFVELKEFLTIGVLGGFTTFSTFSVDALKLWQEKKVVKLIFYVLVNMIGGLIFFSLGFIL